MARTITLDFIFSFLLSFSFYGFVSGDFNVANFGAKPDGKTDASSAFLSAWTAACTSPVPATVHVPHGEYLLKPVAFSGPCKNARVSIQVDGIIVAPANYAAMGAASSWLLFNGVNGVSVSGGYFDGRGKSLWACKNGGKQCPIGATTLAFENSKNVVISGLTSANSQLYHIVIKLCENVHVQRVRILAPHDSPNTDGIHVQQSTGVHIFHMGIKTGDDCISIGPGTQNMWIERVACGPGHGISIGSLGKATNEAGVRNVTVKNVVLNGTENGLRIKTWQRASNGFVRDVVFQWVVMKNAKNPIIIDQHYCPNKQVCPSQNSGIKISQVSYRHIKGTSASKFAVLLDCSPSNPCEGIRLQDIQLTYQNRPAQSFCRNAHGTAISMIEPPSCL